MARPFIIDADVILHFYCRLGEPDVLLRVCGEDATVAERVKREVEYHASEPGKTHFLEDIKRGSIRVIDVGPAEETVAGEFGTSFLHAGERDTAALAVTRIYTMLTNDVRARATLTGSGITIHDAKWVLQEAKKRRIITAAEHKRLGKR
jgi:predicted nucleic acid-binding protein